MEFFYTRVRNHWAVLANPNDLHVQLPFANDNHTECYVERTERFIINSNGQTKKINYSRVNHSRQKEIISTDRISARNRGQLPVVLNRTKPAEAHQPAQPQPQAQPEEAKDDEKKKDGEPETEPEPEDEEEPVRKKKLLYKPSEFHAQFPLPATADAPITSRVVMETFLQNNPSVMVDHSSAVQSSDLWKKLLNKAAVSAWFRCYQKRLDHRVEYFLKKHAQCPSDKQITDHANLQGWTAGGGEECKKLIKAIKRKWKLKPVVAYENRRDQTRLSMTKNYTGNAPMQSAILAMTKSQLWPDLQIVEEIIDRNGTAIGRGVVTTAFISASSVICDYHQTAARSWTKKEANAEIAKDIDNNENSNLGNYVIFAKFGPEVYNATREYCDCHPDIRTFGRLFNWASTSDELNRCNAAINHYTLYDIDGPRGSNGPKYKGAMLCATRDIQPFEELRWDYGDKVCRKYFTDVQMFRGGPGQDDDEVADDG